jgi:hypothetical protein
MKIPVIAGTVAIATLSPEILNYFNCELQM